METINFIGEILIVFAGVALGIWVLKSTIDANTKPKREQLAFDNFLKNNPTHSVISGLAITQEIADRHKDYGVVLVQVEDEELGKKIARNGMYEITLPPGEHKISAFGFHDPELNLETVARGMLASGKRGSKKRANHMKKTGWVEMNVNIAPGKKYAVYFTKTDERFYIEELGSLNHL